MKTKQGPAQTWLGCYSACLLTLSISNAIAAPQYDHDRKELESILEDLLDWLPGEWSSQPQIHYENTVRMPLEGEHEPWHRSFARIVAPQVGPYVIYGQINLGGPDGPIYQRSQVLYNISIDEQRGVVLVRGQPILDAAQFVNLQDRPELWDKVKMPNEAAIRCDFVWHRDGEQIVGVLDGRTPDYRGGGPGTCTYQTASGKTFFAESEWTLSPETLWMYDTNILGGQQFTGRIDRTHTKLYRARPYLCTVRSPAGRVAVNAHDRGYVGAVTDLDGAALEWRLLRARYPASGGVGLDDELRLTIGKPDSREFMKTARGAPRALSLSIQGQGISIKCELQSRFGPLPRG